MKSVLVTGGCGFIGSHTCLSLIDRGYNLLVIDSCVNSFQESLKKVKKLSKSNGKIKYFKGDLRDVSFLKRVFKYAKESDKPIMSVIHFAGLKSVNESIKFPLKYWDNNVIGSLNLFKIMDEFSCRTIVFSSSACIYGSASNSLIKEDCEIKPINPYGQTKSTIEKILNDLFVNSLSEWRIVCLRYFNPVGAHPSGEIGEDPFGIPNNLFPYISQVAIGRRKELYIYGSNWQTIDGTGVRDYIHIMDLAEAHHASLEYLISEKKTFLTLNVGTGLGTSVLQMLRTFENINNCIIPYKFKNKRLGDAASIIADNKKALSTLNWSPKRNLNDMCRDGWKWQKNNPYGYQK